jgi:hypothetical protein
MTFDKSHKNRHKLRYDNTLKLLDKYIPHKQDSILDLGEENPFSEMMKEKGYLVQNTPKGMDLDKNYLWLSRHETKVATAFEIFEHLLNPYQILKELKAERLIVTIPLNLWFAKAYKSKTDKWDQHFHEFEDWQFDSLLEKTGWKIIHHEKWRVFDNKIGLRPILRRFYPRIYAVVAKRI